MARRLVVTPLARSDLIEIGRYIARDSVAAADRLVERLDAVARLFAEHPGMGRPRRDVPRPDLRAFVVRPYIIFYRELSDGIEVVRIVHGRRNMPGIV